MTAADVLSVASEVYPLIKTGGLADVVGALPAALKAEGFALTTLVPGYPAVLNALEPTTQAWLFADLWGGPARLLSGRTAGLDLFVLDAPHLFSRPGGPYSDIDGQDWRDNAIRFAALASVGARLGQGLLDAYRPSVVHAHDWQAGLTSAYLHYSEGPRPATVMSVHNLAFQGQFDRSLLRALGLPDAAYTPDGVEYYGSIGYLKAGLRLSDRITTVSPAYAAEICTPDGGMGLDGLLRGRADKLYGILNGIDTAVWNPRRDTAIRAQFDAADLAPRGLNKADLQARLGLTVDPDAPLFAVVSRLSWQKGLDLLLGSLPVLLAEGAQLALLGSGDGHLEAAFASAAASNPSRVACVFGYDEGLAHTFQAGADVIIVPSRFEPCGLTQLCALRYGAVPLVSRVGGLSDTVIDAGPMALAAGVATGVQFSPVSDAMFDAALRRTAALYHDKIAWKQVQANGLATDVSWRRPAHHYATLYRDLLAERTS